LLIPAECEPPTGGGGASNLIGPDPCPYKTRLENGRPPPPLPTPTGRCPCARGRWRLSANEAGSFRQTTLENRTAKRVLRGSRERSTMPSDPGKAPSRLGAAAAQQTHPAWQKTPRPLRPASTWRGARSSSPWHRRPAIIDPRPDIPRLSGGVALEAVYDAGPRLPAVGRRTARNWPSSSNRRSSRKIPSRIGPNRLVAPRLSRGDHCNDFCSDLQLKQSLSSFVRPCPRRALVWRA